MQVKDIMTQSPLVFREKEQLGAVAKVFLDKKIDGAPIVDFSGKLVSIVTKTDLIKAYVSGVALDTPISVFGRKDVLTINPETDIRVLFEIHVGRLPVVDERGGLIGMVTRTDIGRGLIEDGLEETRELNSIFRSSKNGFLIVDARGIITRFNPSAARIFDLGDRLKKGGNVSEVLPVLKMDVLLATGESYFSRQLNYGDKILFCDRMPLLSKGSIVGGIAIFQDVSEFAALFDELQIARQLSERLDAVIESSYDGIYITDGDANTLRINKSYERMSGVDRKELIGRNMRDLEKEGYVSRSVTLLVIDTKKAVTIEQSVKTGKRILVTGNPILDENGEIKMVVTNVRDITELTLLKEELEKNRFELEEMKLQLMKTDNLIFKSQKIAAVIQLAKRIAPVDTTVMLLGETGVGKEEFAKYIHRNSLRKDGPFIKINCGAIPMNLLESELFGYEKGAFTGASPHGKPGLFELAARGTLLLDEIAELPFDMQVKLLRVLQEHEIKRVGGLKSIEVDVRIIAATNRNLEAMVREKKFREDLYYRLNIVPINIPPLRERKADILPFVFHFLEEYNARYGWKKRMSPGVLRRFYEYGWPGNVRELKNMVERLVVMTDGDEIAEVNLPAHIAGGSRANEGDVALLPLADAVIRLEAELIEKAFSRHGNVRAAAHSLGIDASTFVRKRQRIKRMQERELPVD